MMKLSLLSNLLNVLLLSNSCTSEAQRSARIVVSPLDYDALSHLNLSDRNYRRLWQSTHRNYELVDLNSSEAWQINSTLATVTSNIVGTVSENEVISIDEPKIGDNIIETTQIVSPYLQAIPSCPTRVNYVAIILDTYIINDQNIFKDVTITYGSNLAAATPGVATHGSKVCAIIAGANRLIPNSGISCHGITVFGDDSRGMVSFVLDGIKEAEKLHKDLKSQGKRSGVNFSGVSSQNRVLDLATADVAEIMLTTVAAGNYGEYCDARSPARASGNVMSIGATRMDNGSKPTYFTNWGCQDKRGKMLYVPGQILTPNFDEAGNSYFSGTSGSAPLMHRIFAYFADACPSCKPEQTINSVYAISKRVYPPDSSQVKTPMQLIPAEQACPNNQTPDNNYFCLRFEARSTTSKSNTAALISLDGGKNIRISKQLSSRKFRLFKIQQDGTELAVYVQTKTGDKLILRMFKEKQLSTYALGSTNGRIKYRNIARC